jgi:hypothetical protein
MPRLKILIWHIHGSYLDAITSVEHDWYLPVQPGHYGGRRWSSPAWVHDVPADRVGELDLDLIIFQSPKNYQNDQFEILTPEQRALPRIYLEHNTPKPSAYDTRHVVDDPRVLLVHVTRYNQLMWDNGDIPTQVIEHTVAIDRSIRYMGFREEGIMVVNGAQHRPRIAGYDIFLAAREHVPLEACGIDTEKFGGMGDIPYRYLHQRMAEYRFLFSPMRYTSLPLAVIEAMTIGMPVVALATTEVPSVLENGTHGFVSCDTDELMEGMRFLLSNPAAARRMGEAARKRAETRFGPDRFVRDWNQAFMRAIELGRSG